MSILFEGDAGTLLSTEKYINMILDMDKAPKINSNLFHIVSPYAIKNVRQKKKKFQSANKEQETDSAFLNFGEEVMRVQDKYSKLLTIIRSRGFLTERTEQHTKNVLALTTAEFVYEESGKNLVVDAFGSNFGPATIKIIQNSRFLFPENCQFFCKDVNVINTQLLHKQFDLILLDPPWWNKYVRRKRKKCPHAYKMMYNCDLKQIPIGTLLNDAGIVVVWCTNSPQHLNFLLEDIFPQWNVHFVAKWYWLKVTVHGEPICEFSKPPGDFCCVNYHICLQKFWNVNDSILGKQPFEQIIIGYRDRNGKNLPPNDKLLVSVPSAIHSHKPPLVNVLKPFLPENPKCLEVFARYLLPNYTSYGDEVLRFQHECLYNFEE